MLALTRSSGIIIDGNIEVLENLNIVKPWLVVSENKFYSKIHQKIFFLRNQTLIESYQFKNFEREQEFGILLSNQTFQWKTKEMNFYKRRGNFGNTTLFGMALPWSFETILPPKWMDYVPKTSLIADTYDVNTFLRLCQ